MRTSLPSIFVSHGSPMIALEPGDAGAFMQRLGPAIDAAFGRPKAIVSVSAHTAARVPVVLGAARHEAIYDFGNFDPPPQRDALRRARRPGPGRRACPRCCRPPASTSQLVHEGGLDHGAWTALRYIYPEADIPIVPLAFVPSDPPAQAVRARRRARRAADDGVLVLGSGSITHNLRRVFSGGGLHPDQARPEIPESAAFRRWIADRAAARDWDALFAYRAPGAACRRHASERRAPAALVRGGRRRRRAGRRCASTTA